MQVYEDDNREDTGKFEWHTLKKVQGARGGGGVSRAAAGVQKG